MLSIGLSMSAFGTMWTVVHQLALAAVLLYLVYVTPRDVEVRKCMQTLPTS